MEPVRTFCGQEERGSIFRDLARKSFMYGPLSSRWPLQYGVLQQCVELVITSGVSRISEEGWGLAGVRGRNPQLRMPLGVWGLRRRKQGGLGMGPQRWAIFAIF